MRFLRDAEVTRGHSKGLGSRGERLGFVFRRQRGSHAIYVRQSDQARVVIPMHKGELKRKTLRAIIQDLKISVEEFGRML